MHIAGRKDLIAVGIAADFADIIHFAPDPIPSQSSE